MSAIIEVEDLVKVFQREGGAWQGGPQHPPLYPELGA